MDSLKLSVYESVESAPTYNSPEHKSVRLKEASIVLNGTQKGRATVDLVMEDDAGQKYVALVKATYMKSIVEAIIARKGL